MNIEQVTKLIGKDNLNDFYDFMKGRTIGYTNKIEDYYDNDVCEYMDTLKMYPMGMITLQKGGNKISIRPLSCVFPSGNNGIRLDFGDDDFGTIVYDAKERKWKVVNW